MRTTGINRFFGIRNVTSILEEREGHI